MRNAIQLGLSVGLLFTGLAGLAGLTGCGSAQPRAETGPFKLEDVVKTTDDALRVQVNRREVPLEQMPMASLLAGLPMAGLADVAIDLTIPGAGGAGGAHDYQRAAGSIALRCPAGCTLGDDAAQLQPPHQPGGAGGGVPFGHVTFDQVDLRAEVHEGHLEVTRWQVASGDLTLDLKLDVHLAAELDDSTLDGCLRFKPSPELAARDPRTAAALASTGAPRGPDGTYSIKIEGRVGERRLLGQPCT